MSPGAIQELLESLRPRYCVANRAQKKVILDEFCATTEYHRKAAIRALRRKVEQEAVEHRGRPPVYHSAELVSTLLLVWQASGFMCSKYLVAAMPDLAGSLDRCGKLLLDNDLRTQLLKMSAATIERILRSHRKDRPHSSYVGNHTVSDLSHKIALHTFAELRDLPVGHVETDLVMHCGMTTSGFHLCTAVAVDTRSSWTECVPVWGKGKERVAGAIARIHQRLPFPLLGLHTDNGGEFINDVLYAYSQQKKLDFSHSRPYHKNDQPRVEQRNNSVVRRTIGYGRYTTHEAFAQLDRIYLMLSLHSNFFQPTAKLVHTEREGGKITKLYDPPQTPYRRLLASEVLDEAQRSTLEKRFQSLNPLQLQQDIALEIDKLWKMEAVDPASERAQRLRTAAYEEAHK